MQAETLWRLPHACTRDQEDCPPLNPAQAGPPCATRSRLRAPSTPTAARAHGRCARRRAAPRCFPLHSQCLHPSSLCTALQQLALSCSRAARMPYLRLLCTPKAYNDDMVARATTNTYTCTRRSSLRCPGTCCARRRGGGRRLGRATSGASTSHGACFICVCN